jgi:hypothetical protein
VAIIGFVALGYLVGLPVVRWLRKDLQSFRRMLWTGYGNRDAWRRAAGAAYILGGWPVLVIAATWHRSELRHELMVERDDFRDARHRRDSSDDSLPSV